MLRTHLKESSEQLVGFPALSGRGGWIWLRCSAQRLLGNDSRRRICQSACFPGREVVVQSLLISRETRTHKLSEVGPSMGGPISLEKMASFWALSTF